MMRSRSAAWGLGLRLVATPSLGAQTTGREAVEALTVTPLEFQQPEATWSEIAGVPLLYLTSDELPLATLYAYFRGGYGLFPRERYASTLGLPALLRNGGTLDLAPDSVDELLEFHAVQTTFEQDNDASVGPLVTMMQNEESVRVKNKVCEGIAAKGWAMAGSACAGPIPPAAHSHRRRSSRPPARRWPAVHGE